MKHLDPGRVNFAVFFTSFSILAYQLIFVRIYAHAQWANLSSLIITMALLGFGASGSLITLFTKRIQARYETCFSGALILFPVFLCMGFIISCLLDFNPYEMALSLGQALLIFLYFFLMGLPFFWGGAVICLAFLGHRASITYFYNLMGSGAGALAVLAASFALHPYDMMGGVIVLALAPALGVAARAGPRPLMAAGSAAVLVTAALAIFFSFPGAKKVSQFKSISSALTLPRARIIHEAYSPLSVVQVVEAEGLRTTAGLSLVSPFQVPVQQGLFFNSDAMSPITPFSGNVDEIAYARYLASFLPFVLLDEKHRNQVLIVGTGGGESILKALASGYKHIDGVEANPNVISLMKNQLTCFSGNIYNLEKVSIFHKEARSFIRQRSKTYDLIELSLVDSYNTSVSGVSALNETFLYTIESVQDFFLHLNDHGVLAFTRWISTPPRDNIKLFNLVITALGQLGIKEVHTRLIAIRSLQTLTLLVSKSPVPDSMILGTKTFARERLFDLVYYPGIRETEVNQYIMLEKPVYYQAMKHLLSRDAPSFVAAHEFDISPATDNRPYFYNFFKPALIHSIQTYGPAQVPVTEWGYLILVILLLPVGVISFFLILVPLILKAGPIQAQEKEILVYFALIGLGFFFIEMPLIQKMIQFLGHPSYSLSIVLAGLLVFSGLGSLFSARIFPKGQGVFLAILMILLITSLFHFGLDWIFSTFISCPVSAKILVVLMALAPLGFFLGFPFPRGLERVKQINGSLVAWAFGVNGFFSVISILSATLLAMIFGYPAVFTLAILCYATAGWVWLRFK